jgi:hypothetical protein
MEKPVARPAAEGVLQALRNLRVKVRRVGSLVQNKMAVGC